MTRTARLRAFAKLNLGLRVLYKRPDNFHELRTVFQTISLADVLEVSCTEALTSSVEIAGTPHIADNLVERAARAVLDALEMNARVHVELNKSIPAGAGLGGGSSDAAAMLLALPVLLGKHPEPSRLFAIAAELGSDVPFFLHGGTALGLGRGEELYPLPDRQCLHGLLVTPEVHSSTAEAYRGVSERLTSIPLQNKLFSFQQEVWSGGVTGLVNDFEEVVFAAHPELQTIAERLRGLGAGSTAMTGSGSAVFGLFTKAADVVRAREALPSHGTFAISFVSRAQYRSRWSRMLRLHTKGDQWPPRSLYAG